MNKFLWSWRRRGSGIVLAGALLAAAELGPARAAMAAPAQPAGDDEVGRAVGGTLLGSGVFMLMGLGGLGLVVIGALSSDHDAGGVAIIAGAGVVLAAPAVAGLTTCGYQNGSNRYHAGCGGPVLAAYAGAVGGWFLTYTIAKNTRDYSSGTGSLFVLAPLIILPSASAALTWQLLREPVPAARIQQASLGPRPTFERRRQRPGGWGEGMALVLPLVSSRF